MQHKVTADGIMREIKKSRERVNGRASLRCLSVPCERKLVSDKKTATSTSDSTAATTQSDKLGNPPRRAPPPRARHFSFGLLLIETGIGTI